MTEPIRIKPHHFLDMLRDFGGGADMLAAPAEPHPYGHAYAAVGRELWRDPDRLVEMDLGADAVCEPCKHNVNGLCRDTIDTSFRPAAPSSKRVYNLLIDDRWCERLEVSRGMRMTAREFVERVRERIGEDIADIYREMPPESNADREAKLREGVRKYLEL